jgi:flotillin
MRYRVGGPLIDALMAEIGMTGGSLNGILAGAAAPGVAAAAVADEKDDKED